MRETKPQICVCGCSEELHIDGCEQCCVPECGCKEFEAREEINYEAILLENDTQPDDLYPEDEVDELDENTAEETLQDILTETTHEKNH